MYPGVELRLLRYVVAVAEELHFSRAAAKVHVAQPTLSKQIRDLEEEMGTPLFDRTNRHVRLTTAGRVFVKEAEKALVHSDRAVRLARMANPVKNSQLRVGYTSRMNLRLLSAIRRLLAADHRSLRAALQSFTTAEQTEALLEGSLEVGIVTLPVHHGSLLVEQVLREPLVAAISDCKEAQGSKALCIARLGAIPLICRARRLNSQSHDHLLKELRKAGYNPPSIVEVTTDLEALHLVNEGLGVCFVKASAMPFHAHGNPLFCRIDANLFEETGLAYRRANRARNVREFVESIRTHKKDLVSQSLLHLDQHLVDHLWSAEQLKLF
jgi:DNA-binding transcriptional LysR family regulator